MDKIYDIYIANTSELLFSGSWDECVEYCVMDNIFCYDKWQDQYIIIEHTEN